MDTMFKHRKTIKELNSLVDEGKQKFNILKQVLINVKHTTTTSLSQSIKTCELENTNLLISCLCYELYFI
jgi:hypothetical protein